MSEKGKDQGLAGQPLEDRALKSAAALFGEELLPLIGIKGKVLRIAPTEQVKLPQMDYMEDFNYEMEDGSFLHLEFESDSILIKDLRRYRSYESLMGQQFGVRVATYVICSSNVQEQGNQEREELMRMESVLYTLAMKFLTTEELRNMKEMMHMTILGEMILNDGIEKGAHTERANSVLDLLEDTGRIPRELIDAVHKEQDMERLRRWRKLAARVKSIEEFQQKYMDL